MIKLRALLSLKNIIIRSRGVTVSQHPAKVSTLRSVRVRFAAAAPICRGTLVGRRRGLENRRVAILCEFESHPRRQIHMGESPSGNGSGL